MIILPKRHWLVRVAYFGNSNDIPFRTTLCDLFWRTILTVLLVCTLATAFGWGLFLAGVWIKDNLRDVLRFVGYFVTVAAFVAGWLFFAGWVDKKLAHYRGLPPNAPKPPGLIRLWWRAFKDHYCPLVEIRR